MRRTLVVTILTLLVGNVLLFCLYGQKVRYQQLVIDSLRPYADQVNVLSNNLMYNISSVDDSLSPDIPLTDAYGEERTLESVMEGLGAYAVIVRFSDSYCHSCVEYSVRLMHEVEKDSLINLPVIYVAGTSKRTLFEEQVEDLGLNFESHEIYNSFSLGLSGLECNGYPYYLLVDEHLNVRFCYYPTKGMSDFDKETFVRACRHVLGSE